jgi:hypothetical protein
VEAFADMPVIPMEECRTTLDRVPLLTGLEIKPGFTRKVSEIMGGTKGCTHLATLTKAMAQEIVHGWLTEKRRNPAPLPDNLEDIKEKGFLVDSCRMWKKDGPKIQALARAIQQASRDSKKQGWYWTKEWQKMESQADEDIEKDRLSGKFDSATEGLKWLKK